jgi:TolB protein
MTDFNENELKMNTETTLSSRPPRRIFNLPASLLALVCLWLLSGLATRAEDFVANIDREAALKKLIKVSISGFSGEVLSVLKFDLDVAGFTNSAPEEAQFLISGSNTDHVEGRVQDRITKTQLFGTAYSGGDLRFQAHAFSDAIVFAVRHVKGIAQTKIVFKSVRGKTSELYVSDYDGYNAVPATRDGSIVAAPCWVPGKRAIYYTSYKQGNPDIFYQDLSTGSRKAVARYSGLNTSVAVSPDGRRIAMILSKNGSPDVFVADADGGNLKQLTKTKEDESSPCWSPDGKTICFTSRLSGRAALYTVPSDGGNMKRLATDGTAPNCTEPDWSPDGQSIIFTSQVGHGFNICVVKVATGSIEVVASGEDPSWASNSRTVVFARRVGYKRVLSLLDVPTKRVKDIAQISGSCSQPNWAK